MFFRDETKPVTRWGIEFKSGGEVTVAEQLDAFGIEWAYERAQDWGIAYLPDFTIVSATDPALDVPLWIERKPAELLYAARDHFELPERFDHDQSFAVNAVYLKGNVDDELWKPKLLAEVSGERVLVVHQINKFQTVSIMMTADHVTFSRRHPLVNWKGVLKEREKQQREIAFQERMTQWRKETALREALVQKKWDDRSASNLAAFKSITPRGAKYGGSCCVCWETKPAPQLAMHNFSGQWFTCCWDHLR
jgi:hypothetical protein